MHIADMAAAGFRRAGPWPQCAFKSAFIDVADDLFHKMTTPHIAVAVNAEHSMACATGASQAAVPPVIDRKQRIEAGEKGNFVSRIVFRITLEGIHPNIYSRLESGAQRLQKRKRLFRSDNSHA